MGKYSPDANDYYQKVGAYLRSKWVDQPDVSALGGQRPFVLVEFHILSFLFVFFNNSNFMDNLFNYFTRRN